ncbi:NADH-quinone oxidoreductase subunit F [Raoultella terrigena]|uniref:NADH-quinone oxidoreductase subunit F n=1 Tax=Raoultella terrigena TaxID=577 RepID=A0A3P8M246_RAOTE|nr:NADH-quinone oxidoreductase subunit F [Raoultella terrigena]
MEFESIGKAGSRLGTSLAMAVDHEINMVSLVRNLEEFFARESCGWCTPCRDGLPWSVKILRALERGEGQPEISRHLSNCVDSLGRVKPSARMRQARSNRCKAPLNISATNSKQALSSSSVIPMQSMDSTEPA